MRVQIPAYMDAWMMGDRYGSVERVTRQHADAKEIARVKLDKSGKIVRVFLEDCTEV